MTAEEQTSPAKRLVDIVLSTRGASSGQPGRAFWGALAQALKTKEDDQPRFWRRYALVLGLPSQIRAIGSRPELAAIPSLVQELPTIEGVLAQPANLATPSQQVLAQIPETTVVLLRAAHEVIVATGYGEPILPTEELATLREELYALLNDVLLATDLSPTLRSFLLRSIRRLLAAIEDSDLTGEEPIAEAVIQAAGEVRLTDEDVTASGHPLAERLWKFEGRAASLLTLGNQAIALAQHGVSALGLSHHPPPPALGPGPTPPGPATL